MLSGQGVGCCSRGEPCKLLCCAHHPQAPLGSAVRPATHTRPGQLRRPDTSLPRAAPPTPQAVAIQPVVIGFYASLSSFSSYSGGVYQPTGCESAGYTDHAMLLYGWGTLNGVPVWLIKNSWSTYWGDQGERPCSVALAACSKGHQLLPVRASPPLGLHHVPHCIRHELCILCHQCQIFVRSMLCAAGFLYVKMTSDSIGTCRMYTVRRRSRPLRC